MEQVGTGRGAARRSGAAAFLVAAILATVGRCDVTYADDTARGPERHTPRLPSPEELKNLPADGGADYNRLVFEKSPYLLQHATNPVDWYPWGAAAFDRARAEDKPVFLSIGYSTCHWCHVMEHESFENPAIAQLLNAGFVAVKVDREERPDIDDVYMNVCVALTGQGGWPLTILMTPDGKPFFAGTYFPREARLGKPGLTDVLSGITDAWTQRRDQVFDSAERIAEAVSGASRPQGGDLPGAAVLEAAYEQLASRYDAEYGGFGDAPKFPTPHNLLFLLRWWHRSGDEKALEMVGSTLKAMRLGGVYDHVGYGFHRYSTDRRWFLPHFEKMLYDQALLLMAYTEAFQATADPFFERVAREIAAYVVRDMTSPEGGFYSAEDADSEGEEGLFYLWTPVEFQAVLGDDEGAYFAGLFGLEPEGNFVDESTRRSTGRNIPFLERDLDEVARAEGTKPADLRNRWDAARAALFAAREKRVHPYKDDKILTSWNGLMIAALAKAAQALDEPAYAAAAERAAGFLLRQMRTSDGRLLRRFRDGEAGINGYVDDYAFLTWGLLDLFEATQNPVFLEQAADVNRRMLNLFQDEEGRGLYFTGSDAEVLIDRRKEIYDGALPSGNSVAALNMARLSRLTGDTEMAADADGQLRAFSTTVSATPSAFTQYLVAVDFATGPGREIVIVGDPADSVASRMLRVVRSRFLPRTVLIVRPEDAEQARGLIAHAPYLEAQGAVRPGAATAYVCENYACRAPVTDPDELDQALNGP